MKSRGLKNNNPLNIRKNTDFFEGEVAVSTDTSFKQFCTMAHGYRAAFVMLGTYLLRGQNTIEKIVSRWAPPNENNTAGYINHVEQWSGVARDKELTAASGDDYLQIVVAMSRVENGTPANIADVEEGFNLQTKIKKTIQ
jgi:hypothetical protein